VATTVITGRDLSLTIDSKSYDAQATSVTLETTLDRQAYETLDGRVFKAIDSDATLTVEMLADWGASGGGSTFSICELLWDKASTAPDTSLAYTFTAATGAVFTGNLYPSFPAASGSGKDAQTVTFTLQCTAKPTLTIS
jgi:hypothetical protein